MAEAERSSQTPAHMESVLVANPAFSRRHMLSALVVIVLAVATLLGATQVGDTTSLTPDCLLTFMVILSILWIAIWMEISRRPFSLNLMHLVAVYVFLAVAPLYQVIHGAFPVELFTGIDADYVLRGNLLVILWLISYLSFYTLGAAWSSRRIARRGGSRLEREVPRWRIDGALLLSFGVMAYLAAIGLAGVTTRGAASEALLSETSSPLVLINSQFVRAFPVVALGAGLLLVTRSFRRTALFTGPLVVLCLLGNLYANNPLASARYWTVAVILGLLAPQILQRRATGALTLLGVVAAFAILPGLGLARNAVSLSEMLDYFRDIPSPAMYLAVNGDADAYGVLVLVLRYVDRDGLRLGQQLLGVLLFWVPRSIWHAKPIGTGAFVASSFAFDFTNLSAPVPAEPFIDFGWIGVPVFAALFALILAHLDTAFWRRQGSEPSGVRSIDTLYPFLLGMIIFMTRGDLLSSFAYTLGFFASVLIPYFIGVRTRPSERQGLAP